MDDTGPETSVREQFNLIVNDRVMWCKLLSGPARTAWVNPDATRIRDYTIIFKFTSASGEDLGLIARHHQRTVLQAKWRSFEALKDDAARICREAQDLLDRGSVNDRIKRFNQIQDDFSLKPIVAVQDPRDFFEAGSSPVSFCESTALQHVASGSCIWRLSLLS